jgi:hypothetical protein
MDSARCTTIIYATLPELVGLVPEEPPHQGSCRTLRASYCARTPDERALWLLNATPVPYVGGLDVRPDDEPGRVRITETSYDVPVGDTITVSVSAAMLALTHLHREVG